MTTEEILYKHYRKMFDELIKEVGDDLHELSIKVELVDGYSIKKSWIDRDKRLSSEERR